MREELLTSQYDICRNFIERKRNEGKSRELISFLANSEDSQTNENLERKLNDNYEDHGWPELTIDDWKDLVDHFFDVMDAVEGPSISVVDYATWGGPSQDLRTTWNLYLRKLREENNWSISAIQNLKVDCIKITSLLSEETASENPRRGLVVGNVQSGKTANMAGVIALAAERGFNFFIVLSGVLENLRLQTLNRLYDDLTFYERRVNCLHNWEKLEHLGEANFRLNELRIQGNRRNIYLTVCLKQRNRLTQLIKWLQSTQDNGIRDNLKILIIDDECDQGSINTADVTTDEITRIAELIRALCFNSRVIRDGEIVRGNSYGSVNYVAYTATPYGNLLNEAGDNTLYPRDFIATLSNSQDYWGPDQIFGCIKREDENNRVFFERRPFLNEIETGDLNLIRQFLNDRIDADIPPSLKEAIKWFVCASAIQRLNDSKKPVTMLIHPSSRITDHDCVAEGIERFLNNLSHKIVNDQRVAVLGDIRKTYEEQCNKLPYLMFVDKFSDYCSRNNVEDYPSFNLIEEHIINILSVGIQNITCNDDQTLEYSRGIHFCVDNSDNNGITEDNRVRRIMYPRNGIDQMPDFATLFIVVGGNTLSRGLTLEGLVSSYFLRGSTQADSLMQMGRWFGYRFGYELLPRIWVSEDTALKFCALNQIDLILRKSLMELEGRNPQDFRVIVPNPLGLINNLKITSRNKSQMAVPSSFNYGGTQRQLTSYSFVPNDLDCAKRIFQNFISQHTNNFNRSEFSENSMSMYCENINWDEIKSIINNYPFDEFGRNSVKPETVIEFVENKLEGRNWTVIVVDSNSDDIVPALEFNGRWIYSSVRKCQDFNSDSRWVRFKSITSPTDILHDINPQRDCNGRTFESSFGALKYRALSTKKDAPIFVIKSLRIRSDNSTCVRDENGNDIVVFGFVICFPQLNDAQTQISGWYNSMVETGNQEDVEE